MKDEAAKVRNIELKLSYVGTAYKGWQIQPKAQTVQGVMNRQLRRLLQVKEFRSIGSSRTDSGVHAHDQRMSFFTTHPFPIDSLKRALNHGLPPDIRVHDAVERPADFSSRYASKAKLYSYVIFNKTFVSPFVSPLGYTVRRPLDTDLLNRAAAQYVGRRCFRLFQAPRDSRENTISTIYAARVTRIGDLIHFDVVGSHFLYRMVRNMAGALMMLGLGNWDYPTFSHKLRHEVQFINQLTLPGAGLHLMRVYTHEPGTVIEETHLPFLNNLASLLESERPLSMGPQA